MDNLQYPIGQFEAPATYTAEQITAWIKEIEAFPGKVHHAVLGFTTEQFDTPYRPGGWTVRQVIHHLADSHFNCFMRFKLALSEDFPTIRPYEQGEIALLADYSLPVSPSMKILEGLHQRWVKLMHGMNEDQWKRKFYHPGYDKEYTLQSALGMYVWHGNHHLAHIKLVKEPASNKKTDAVS